MLTPQPGKLTADLPLMVRGERGLITIEFTLLIPLLLMVLTTILQIALIVQAKFVVNYAAASALRAAIVAIPREMRSEKTGRTELRNQVNWNDPDSAKLETVHRAAALALTSISPVYGADVARATRLAPDASLAARLGKLALLFPAAVKGQDVSGQIISRAYYAYDKQNTKVEIIVENNGQTARGNFGDHDLVTVRVTFHYYLTVPFANRVFGKPFFGAGWRGGSGYYVTISEQYTLPIEGEPLFPQEQRQRFYKREEEAYL